MFHISRLCLSLFGNTYPHSTNKHVAHTLRRVLPGHIALFSTKAPLESGHHLGEGLFPNKSTHRDVNTHRSSIEMDGCLLDAEINGIGSPISAMCWHKGPYSNYFDGNNGSSDHGHETNPDSEPTHQTSNELYPHVDMVSEMEHLLTLERNEKDRVMRVLERHKPLEIDEHIRDKQLASKVSTMKLLEISSQIAKRRPASAKPQIDAAKYLREKRYRESLDKVTGEKKKGEHKRPTKPEATVETIRILDVDRLPLPILHHMLCYTLVKNAPAERVLNIISNIASLRDKNKHVCYQNLFRLAAENCSPVSAPEIVATLTRCYQSISIPFMVDYVRRYGAFSRKFIANLIERTSRPMPLDLFRYESHARSLPMILTRPKALLSFVNLLKNSSAKRYMYLNLLNYGYVPNTNKFDKTHAFGTMDERLSGDILASEKMLDDTALISDNTPDPNRPKIYDKILELQYTGEANLEDMELGDGGDEPTPTSLQFIKVVGQNDEDATGSQNYCPESVYRDEDQRIPDDGTNVSWTTPWGLKRDEFHFRGKSYKLDRVKGWISVKSNVRINYLKNVRMNKRKREGRLLRRRATKEAKLRVLSTL